MSDALTHGRGLLFGILETLSSRPSRLGPFEESDDRSTFSLVSAEPAPSTAPFSGRKDKRKFHYSAHGIVIALSFELLGRTLLALELYIILDPLRAII